MENIQERKIGVETARQSASQSRETTLPKIDMVGTAVEFAVALGEAGEQVREIMPDTAISPASRSMASARKQIIQQQITRVQQMNAPRLQKGIKKELKTQIAQLKKQATLMSWGLKSFSAYELNNLLSKIRALKEQMKEILKLTIQKLRELYITLVLKLKVIAA